MFLEIIATTDDQNIGMKIETTEDIVLSNGEVFVPDRIIIISTNMWRLYNSNYVIDAKVV